ncbi:MAG: YqhA family protein [Acidimicrobiales bacterium]
MNHEEDVERFLAWSLRLAYIPLAVLLLAGLGAFVYGTALFVHSVGHVVDHPFPIRHQIGLFLEVIDLFLIGATLLISAVGFYELFIREIHRDGSTRIPTWLHMRDLNDLKSRVIAMIVLVVSVSFVELVVDSPSGQQVLDLGGGIAAVVVALTVFLRLGGHGSKSGSDPGE